VWGLLLCRAIGSLAQGGDMTRVLVAYASKMGSTKDIAEAIGAELTRRGLRVEVRNVREADSPDFYDAVVLGSAVYTARWRPEAKRYAKHHTAELTAHPVWLFESGWIGTRPDPLTPTLFGRRRAARIGAAPPTVFGGRLDPDRRPGSSTGRWPAKTPATSGTSTRSAPSPGRSPTQ
jgi:menaquinone-dependent protoporphyrinogen oxidase